MRTRIALVATIGVAVITIGTITQAVSVKPADPASPRTERTTSSGVTAMPNQQLTAFHEAASAGAGTPRSGFQVDLANPLLAGRPAGPAHAAPAPATTAIAGPVDTVTPYQRAAWERVALCEEGGNWAADNGRYSGGLGINRINWAGYGGLQFAPEGAMATEDQQIMVAERIQLDPPDQRGCTGW